MWIYFTVFGNNLDNADFDAAIGDIYPNYFRFPSVIFQYIVKQISICFLANNLDIDN